MSCVSQEAPTSNVEFGRRCADDCGQLRPGLQSKEQAQSRVPACERAAGDDRARHKSVMCSEFYRELYRQALTKNFFSCVLAIFFVFAVLPDLSVSGAIRHRPVVREPVVGARPLRSLTPDKCAVQCEACSLSHCPCTTESNDVRGHLRGHSSARRNLDLAVKPVP